MFHLIFILCSLSKAEQDIMEYYTLNNGVKMPVIGFGTYQIPPPETEKAVLEAIKAGYRCIDTATSYQNEEGVGKAIKACDVPRDQLFIISKLWLEHMTYEKAKWAIQRSLERLQLDYIDAYLIHQPMGDVYGAWRAMEEAYKAGKIRAIGVANFYPDRLVDLILHNEVQPAINQIEMHPFFQREEDIKVMREYKVQPQSWGPFAEGRNNLFANPVLNKIGQAHKKSAAQVVLRWLYQRGVHIIPKSVKPERMAENINSFDFKLSDEEMKEIAGLETHKSAFFDHRDPELVKVFCSMRRNIQ